jgi:glycine/D-amino acid oxidase-like deaminating enzyme
VWQAGARRTFPSLAADGEADVVVVGGGLTGLSTAWHLAEGRAFGRVILLEAGRLGGGASGRAAGNCVDLVGEGVEQLVGQFGRAGACTALAYGRDALSYVTTLGAARQLPFVAGAELLEVATNSHQARKLSRRLALLNELGFGGTRRWLEADVCRRRFPESPFIAAIACETAQLVDPARLVDRWIALVSDTPVQVYENTPVVSLRRDGTRFVVTTPQGSVVAAKVVVATNGFTSGELTPTLSRVQLPILTYCLATRPIGPEIWAGLGVGRDTSFYDANHLLHYFRRTPDDRLLFGGGQPGLGSPTDEQREEHTHALRRQLGLYFPALAGIDLEAVWSGPISITRDLSPALCAFFGGDMIAAVGCIGHGIVSSQYNGKLIADALMGGAKDFPFRTPKRWPAFRLGNVALRVMRSTFRMRDAWDAK